MPTDYYLEQLPDGSPCQPDDIMHIQRNVNGVWTDFQFRQGNINGTDVYIHEGTYTEADLSGQEIVMFTPPVGTVAVLLPMAIVRFQTDTPTGLSEGFQIGMPADQLNVYFTNTNTVERLAVTTTFSTNISAGGSVAIEVSTNIASLSFTLYVRTPYVLVDI